MKWTSSMQSCFLMQNLHTARVGGGKESRGEMKSSLGKRSHDFKCNPYLNWLFIIIIDDSFTHGGFVHDLVLCCTPPPHVLVHGVKSDHSLHQPSTWGRPLSTHTPLMHHYKKLDTSTNYVRSQENYNFVRTEKLTRKLGPLQRVRPWMTLRGHPSAFINMIWA